ncbi:hypothetical protein [Aromatoleum petrolei]|uniref:Uncharacterized protein n=1 Tax=Aromatoleum petrolei TaxID=76116 RepID=A0ABX1MPE2_9RHOO|nr:hypothetical protein [Aromatoleum petrolei]NMF89824.1 hypothetical protein [Aromatoleum petrolei]QTQ35085.1 Uncharacterized protein ToN1_09130 [Aromatoleum petrolei]
MSAIAIHDLSMKRDLDREALASIRGGGAPWVYGWIRPYVSSQPSFGRSVNYYQINNTFIADQMVNQFQVIDVTNTAANSTINVGVGADGSALKL